MIIVNQTIDIAGKFRYWVELDDGSVVMFKFQTEPKTEQDILNAADAYVAQKIIADEREKEQRIEDIDKEIIDLQGEKSELTAEK